MYFSTRGYKQKILTLNKNTMVDFETKHHLQFYSLVVKLLLIKDNHGVIVQSKNFLFISLSRKLKYLSEPLEGGQNIFSFYGV